MTFHLIPTVTCNHRSECSASQTVTSALAVPDGWIRVVIRDSDGETLARDYCLEHGADAAPDQVSGR